jgi:UDP-N-acetylmuramyl pentapeptide phosphotransferase/UDP-N-acetylglucosamine-1-phosphate transferase
MDQFLSENPIILIVGVLLFTAIITAFIIPTVVKVAKIKQLVDVPNGRTSHKGNVPSLGGFAVFAAVSLVILLFVDFNQCFHCQVFLVGLLIIFFIGLKDDIVVIDPYKKLLAQLLAASLIVLYGGVQFTNLHGFLGIQTINPLFGSALTIFVIIVITNSFNLIDGIDGLAAGVGIIASLTLGIWFVLVQEYQLAIISFAIIGGFSTFFYYNISRGRNKIFMGDTGSLILGFSLAYLIIHFNELNLIKENYNIASAPAVSIGILIVPLFDTLRVFLVRTFRGKSPFSPDKGHVHHRLLFLNKTHLRATTRILIFNALFIVMVFVLQELGIVKLLLIEIGIAAIFSYIPIYIIRKKDYNKLSPQEKKEYRKVDVQRYSRPRTQTRKKTLSNAEV